MESKYNDLLAKNGFLHGFLCFLQEGVFKMANWRVLGIESGELLVALYGRVLIARAPFQRNNQAPNPSILRNQPNLFHSLYFFPRR